MKDTFIIGAYWGSRAEPLSKIRDKIILTLNRLTEADDQFLNWYETGTSRKDALKKVILNDETIEKLCLEKVKKKELNEEGYSTTGFLFGLWTGHEDYEASSISFNVGNASKLLTNSCVIKIPLEGNGRERLLHINKVRAILSILVEIWNPEYAVLTSNTLRDKLDFGNRIGWITYHKSLKGIPQFNGNILYEKVHEGYWFYPSSDYDEATEKELFSLKKALM